MSDWKCGEPVNQKVIDEIKKLEANGISPTHLFWHQGEKDSKKGTSREGYKKQFYEMLTCIREYSKAPIFVSVASYRFGFINLDIRKAQKDLVDVSNYIYSGPDTDIFSEKYRRDNIHFNDIGLNLFADLWLEKIKNYRS